MPWTVEYDPDYDIIDGRYVGRVTDEDFRKATVRAHALSTVHRTNRFLIDDSKWEGGVSTLGLFVFPRLFEELGFSRDSKGALVLPPAGTRQEKDAKFFETVCVNRGWQVRRFTGRDEALRWLTGKDPAG